MTSIQPKWLIEENAIILFKEVWFKPPTDPTIKEKIANVKINKDFWKRKLIKNNGAIFCNVIKR